MKFSPTKLTLFVFSNPQTRFAFLFKPQNLRRSAILWPKRNRMNEWMNELISSVITYDVIDSVFRRGVRLTVVVIVVVFSATFSDLNQWRGGSDIGSSSHLFPMLCIRISRLFVLVIISSHNSQNFSCRKYLWIDIFFWDVTQKQNEQSVGMPFNG